MDSHGTPSGSRRPHARVQNIAVPNTSASQTPPPSGVYRPQMPSPTGFASWSPPPNTIPESWVMQTPMVDNNWAYSNLISNTPMTYTISPTQVWGPRDGTNSSSPMNTIPPTQVWGPRDGTNSSSQSRGDDDVVPETQPESPQSSPPPQPKRKTRGKGKNVATSSSANPTKTKAPCKQWSVDEEVALAKAWAETSEDSTIGNYRKGENFWLAVKTSLDIRMQYDPATRSCDAVQTKTRGLLSAVAKFACIYNNASNTRKSGESDVDVLARANERYRGEYRKTFPHDKAWRVLKESPKFVPVNMMNPSDIRAPTNKRSKTTETQTDSPGESDARTYVNVGGDDQPSQTERPRPMGRNAARRAGSSSSTTETDAAIATQLGALATANTGLYDMLYERQRSAHFQFYTSPHNHLSGFLLESTLQEKERLREKYGWPDFEH